MKYEAPELTALSPAMPAIQNGTTKRKGSIRENLYFNEIVAAYEDWE
ncbi:MAG TPA: hypothetical protein VE778_05010 [Candidatus Bathyarchaeia archaeon]|jgi:hypothetical protein|nr:hypothetical protein [Candidatus Bathyarchaeia archaeon]